MEKMEKQEKERYELKTQELSVVPSDENDIWEKPWIISFRRGNKEQIGTVSFEGEKLLGTVPMKMEIKEEYRGKGYGTAVTQLAVKWLFHFRNIYEVTAVTDRENDRAVGALRNCGFVYRESKGRDETYSMTKQKTSWAGLYLPIGVFIGLVIGIITGHFYVGMLIGLLLSESIGFSMDMGENKEREKVTGRKDSRYRGKA